MILRRHDRVARGVLGLGLLLRLGCPKHNLSQAATVDTGRRGKIALKQVLDQGKGGSAQRERAAHILNCASRDGMPNCRVAQYQEHT